MNTRLIMTTLLGAAILSAPVMAVGAEKKSEETPREVATINPAEKCTNLQKQFDAELSKHMTAAKVADAKLQREAGGKLCAGGKPTEGIAKQENALRDIGVKPKG